MFKEKDLADFANFIQNENIFLHDVTINQRCSKFYYKTLAVNLLYVFMTSYQDNMKKIDWGYRGYFIGGGVFFGAPPKKWVFSKTPPTQAFRVPPSAPPL